MLFYLLFVVGGTSISISTIFQPELNSTFIYIFRNGRVSN